MKRFGILAGIMIVTALVLGLTTTMETGSSISQTRLLGAPVVSMEENVFGWLSIGAGSGVVVLGAGVGFVAFTFVGAGLLVGVGQVTAGFIAIGQAGLGLVCFLGQAGTGLVGAGQVVVGGLGWAQGRLAMDGEDFIKKLNEDLNDVLSFR